MPVFIHNKKLSYRRAVSARCFLSLNISLSYPLQMVPFESLGTVSYFHSLATRPYHTVLSLVICKIFQLTCKLCTLLYTKFWNFWHITRLSVISGCKGIWSQKQSGFLAHPVYSKGGGGSLGGATQDSTIKPIIDKRQKYQRNAKVKFGVD